ncbi:hypothetical protein KC345_g7687 [Hortaea werneckii]|nr:hypothetical protein KC345_g7687 [Hortaea werneckii]
MPKPQRNAAAVAEETLTPPDNLSQTQSIARLKQAAGNNLYHVELPSGKSFLAELHQKFRFTIWLKRGMFVLVDAAALAERDNKLGGEIVNVVGDEKAWKKMSYWPAEFSKKRIVYGDESEDEGPQMPPSDDEEN